MVTQDQHSPWCFTRYLTQGQAALGTLVASLDQSCLSRKDMPLASARQICCYSELSFQAPALSWPKQLILLGMCRSLIT